MRASTAGVLGPRSVLCSQELVLIRIFWAYFPSTTYLTCNTGLLAFQRQLLLEYGGGPEKDRNVCFWWCCLLRSLPSNSSGQLDVFGHDGDSPSMDGAQVGVLKQTDKVGLHCFLETQYSC